MVVVLVLLGLAMIATGAASVYFGFPIIQAERGWSMVIAGCGVSSAGAIVLALAAVCHQGRRVQREVRRLGDRIARAGAPLGVAAQRAPEPAASSAPVRAPVVERAPPAEPILVQPPSGRGLEPPPGAVVVGRYASGGNSYVMYSDGSIHADTPSGHHRFGSLEELKSFVAAGGESGEVRPGRGR